MTAKHSFSLAVTGAGTLMDPLLAELTRCFPHATLYDRSAATNSLRGVEANLGREGLLRQQDRAWARRVARNLAAPPPTDVTVDFQAFGNLGRERITVSNRRGSRFKFLMKRPESFAELDAGVRRIVTAIRSLL